MINYISERMRKIVKLLYQFKQLSVEDIAKHLNLSQRQVRYGIDQINQILISKHLEPIQNSKRGLYEASKDFETIAADLENTYVFSQEQRISIILLYLSFDYQHLNLNNLSKVLEVSRQTIKNDLKIIEHYFLQSNIQISYDTYFHLIGDAETLLKKRFEIFWKNAELIFRNNEDDFEELLDEITEESLKGNKIRVITKQINLMLDCHSYSLSDPFYGWFLSQTLIFLWYMLNDEEFPYTIHAEIVKNEKTPALITDLETIIGKKINPYYNDYMEMLFSTLLYSKKQYYLQTPDAFSTENTIAQLLSCLSKKTGISLIKNDELLHTLVDYLPFLMYRSKHHIHFQESRHTLQTESERNILQKTKEICTEIPLLRVIDNEQDLLQLSLLFISAMHSTSDRKKVMLVSGQEQNICKKLKDRLEQIFNIEIIVILSKYRLQNCPYWDYIDLTILTYPTKFPIPTPHLLISHTLNGMDIKALRDYGLQFNHSRNPMDPYIEKLSKSDDIEKGALLATLIQKFNWQGQKLQSILDVITIENIHVLSEETEQQALQQTLSQCHFAGSVQQNSAIYWNKELPAQVDIYYATQPITFQKQDIKLVIIFSFHHIDGRVCMLHAWHRFLDQLPLMNNEKMTTREQIFAEINKILS